MNQLERVLLAAKVSGQSEARTLMEFVQGVLVDEPNNFRLVASCMDEFIDWANQIKYAAEHSP